MLVDVEHPERGTYTTVGCPFTLSDSPVEVKRSPLLGEHNEEVLQELLDTTDGEIERLTEAGAV
jgi:formyl-CoA transferase